MKMSVNHQIIQRHIPIFSEISLVNPTILVNRSARNGIVIPILLDGRSVFGVPVRAAVAQAVHNVAPRHRAGRHRLQQQHGGHGQSRRLFQHRHLFFLPCMEIIGIYIVRLTPPRRQGSKRHFLLKSKLFIGKICAVCTKIKAAHCIFVVIWACKKPPAFGRGLNFREREIT